MVRGAIYLRPVKKFLIRFNRLINTRVVIIVVAIGFLLISVTMFFFNALELP